MLRTTKTMRDKYEKIQNNLFDLIPEKWEEIYLYASVIDTGEDTQEGEMYFYYIPKGILKKKPINVYEVPKRFNINEKEYLKLVDILYNTIKDLRQDFIDTEQELWSSMTISIAHNKFKVEYSYDKISQEEQASYRRHVIWRYKYLGIGGERKEERKILDKYYFNTLHVEKKEEYQTGLYLKTGNNVVGFDKEIEVVAQKKEEQEQKAAEHEEKKNQRLQERLKKEEEKRKKDEQRKKNQILNF